MTSDLSHHRRTARNIAVLFVGVIIGLLLTIGLGGRSASAQPALPTDHCRYSGGGWLCVGFGDPFHADPPVDRLGGADRYDTAAAIAQYDQAEGETVLIVASGNGVDAIAAGTHLTGPMVLVPHGGDTVPQSALDAAYNLAPDRVIVLGGEGAVSHAQEDLIRAWAYEGKQVQP